MTDYITFTINEQVLNNFVEVLMYLMIILLACMGIKFIFQIIEDIKRDRWEETCKPYVKQYEKLQKEKKWEKAQKFKDKYEKYLRENYYW